MSTSVTEVGPGDYVKVGAHWLRISRNTAHGAQRTPRRWQVTVEDGRRFGMYEIRLYAKAADLER